MTNLILILKIHRDKKIKCKIRIQAKNIHKPFKSIHRSSDLAHIDMCDSTKLPTCVGSI